MRRYMVLPALVITCACGGGTPAPTPAPQPVAPTPVVSPWHAAMNGTILQIHHGSAGLQYAALHTDSSYFRLNTGADSGWGTSAVLVPSFWSAGIYHQGGPVSVTWRADGADLVVTFSATTATLAVLGEIRLQPPVSNTIVAVVAVAVNGSVVLDQRPNEAFKPVVLSSMHVSGTQWDARSAFINTETLPLPQDGWILQPAVTATLFGLTGGTSAWKANAPTIDVLLEQELRVTGWVTRSANPNDDNVALWAATDAVLPRWQYRLRALQPSPTLAVDAPGRERDSRPDVVLFDR